MPKQLYRKSDSQRSLPISSPNPLEAEAYRSPWRRDYARIIHSAAFRRLQGKTQLFPNAESDYFRNRLTHSLEVAQIAKSIAVRLNATDSYFKNHNIDTDLVELAGLTHDLGHPPFGHQGEEALDELMRDHGGFEGNAQTLRIIARLENRETAVVHDGIPMQIDQKGVDQRRGLNLTFRSLASILKYNNKIPHEGKDRPTQKVQKGYYYTEAELVHEVREKVLGNGYNSSVKTIECSIMDIADDIAYSTYDLEDAFQGGFLSPLSMISAPDSVLTRISLKGEYQCRYQNRIR